MSIKSVAGSLVLTSWLAPPVFPTTKPKQGSTNMAAKKKAKKAKATKKKAKKATKKKAKK